MPASDRRTNWLVVGPVLLYTGLLLLGPIVAVVAGAFVEGDTLFHDGALPFNTHGGLLSHAYVLGIAHVVECVKQVRGVAAAQVAGCEIAVYGGYTGPSATTLVLGQDR